jgi:spermidine synthase
MIKTAGLSKDMRFLMGVAFIAGSSMMSLELSASRILAPGFGGGIYVWGSLIGVIMAALSAGYVVGGRLADRINDTSILYKALVFAATYTALIPAFGKDVVVLSTLFGQVGGPIAATIALFAAPMALLSMVSPMVIRFRAEKVSTAGSSAGLVYAVSTVGSIFGTFATAFMLLPVIGAKSTILSNAVLLFAIGFLGLADKRSIPLVVIVASGIWLTYNGQGTDYFGGNLVYSGESEYNVISVYDSPQARILKLNWEGAIQSYMSKNDVLTGKWTGYYYDCYLLGPLINDGRRILWLGMAGGTSTKQLLQYYDVDVDAVEIDGRVVEVAKTYFNVSEGEHLRIHTADGRQFLKSSGKYDIINVDVYTGGPDVPAHMATVEFFAEASDHLSEGGILMMNVIAFGGDRELADAVAYTVKQVFPSVFVIDLGGNSIIVASKEKMTEEELISRLGKNDKPALDEMIKTLKPKIRGFEATEGTLFTDDKSNIEEINFKVVQEGWARFNRPST